MVDIEEKDKNGNLLRQVLNVRSSPSVTVTGNYNLVQNGSFQIDSDSDLAPDSWTLAIDSGGTIAIDSTSGGQAHGSNGLKFTGTGSGAGTATSDKFNVLAGSAILTEFLYKSSAATSTNSVIIKWYKFDDTASATVSTTIHSLATGNPVSWASYYYRTAVPSDATRAEIVITGVLSSGTDKIGPTWFDDVIVSYAKDVEAVIYDSSGNEIVKTAKTTDAVNEVTITNAATGNQAKIQGTGEAAGAGLIIEGTGTSADVDINSTGAVNINGKEVREPNIFIAKSSGTSSAVNTKLPFGTEVFDPYGEYDATTNYRYTPQVAGYYKIYASVSSPLGNSSANIAIRKNGTVITDTITNAQNSDVTSEVVEMLINTTILLNGSTDYIELWSSTSGLVAGSIQKEFSALLVHRT